MKTVDNSIGFSGNEIASFRFRCVKILNVQGYAGVSLAFPQVSRATVFRWKKKFTDSGGRLFSLAPISTKPRNLRQMQVDVRILSVIRQLRKNYPHLSKYKLKIFLDAWCRENTIQTYSVSWIGKVISRYQLFFSVRRETRRKRKHPRRGYRIRKTPNPDKISLGYLQLDGVTIYWLGVKYVFLSALEVKTRQAWVKRVKTANSENTKTFLISILTSVSYQVHTIHTDNGSEFQSVFDQALFEMKLTHLWSPPRTPKVQSHIERFNRTLQEEFVNYHIDQLLDSPEEFNQSLKKWIIYYNTVRPHQALNYMTPRDYLIQLQERNPKSLKSV
jgi:transposase InsO family protein